MRFSLICLLFISMFSLSNEIKQEDKDRIFNGLTFIYACPQEDYKLTCINGDKHCDEIGVKGCDRKMIYTKVGSNLILSFNLSKTSILTTAQLSQANNTVAASNAAHEAALAAQAAAMQASAMAAQAATQAALAGANAAMAAQNAAMAAPPPM